MNDIIRHRLMHHLQAKFYKECRSFPNHNSIGNPVTFTLPIT